MAGWLTAIALAVAGAACSFDPRAAGEGSAAPDGGMVAPDTNPTESCAIAAAGSATPTPSPLGAVGTGNGNPLPALVCPSPQLPVTVGFGSTMYPREEGGNERVVVAIAIGCGALSLANGALVVRADPSPPPPTSWTPNDCDSGSDVWTPVVTAPPVGCPANHVLVGLVANGGAGTLFNTVALSCAAVSPTGAVGGDIVSVPVTDTGDYANNPQQAVCPAGEVVSAFAMRGNCGVDQLQPECVPIACTP